MSMKPGATARPVASMTWPAVAPGSGSTARTRSPSMATSAGRRAAPLPSMTVPPLIRMSSTDAGLSDQLTDPIVAVLAVPLEHLVDRAQVGLDLLHLFGPEIALRQDEQARLLERL